MAWSDRAKVAASHRRTNPRTVGPSDRTLAPSHPRPVGPCVFSTRASL